MTALKRLREQKGMTATSVAQAVRMDQSYYSKIENGRATASPEVAAKLAGFFAHEITEMQILYPERYEVEAA